MRSAQVVLPVLLSALAPLHAGNVLTNPGFETGDFTGWTVGGNTPNDGVNLAGFAIPGVDPVFGTTPVLVHSGSYAAWADVECTGGGLCAPSVYITLQQTVAVTPGQIDTVGFWEANGSALLFGQDIGNSGTQIFVNGTGILASNNVDVDNSYQELSGSFNTGSNTSVTVIFQIDGSGESTGGISLDDFFVDDNGSATPEPQTWSLMTVAASGLLVAVLRRRFTA